MNTNRRDILLGGVALLGLGGCSSVASVVGNLPQYAQDAQTIAQALQQVVTDVGAIKGVPASIVASVQGLIGKLTGLASQIGASATGVAGGTTPSLLSSFGQTALNIVSSLGGANATGTLGTILQGVLSVLPTILSVAGVALAGPPGGMSPAEGRSTLQLYVARAR